ncbi:MAG: FIST N-terminal domain-containing protein [Chloroflexota bacterium]|nr:FIST C-terminal domain-containing protein [Chloroflexota bacterium]
MTKAQAVLVQNPDWREVVQKATSQLASFGRIDLLFVFASATYESAFPELIRALYNKSGAAILMGCSGQSVIGQEYEIEQTPAVALLALALPDAKLEPVHLTQADLHHTNAAKLPSLTGMSGLEVNAWLLLGDPFTLREPERMLELFSEAYPGRPLIGGMASGEFTNRQTSLFLNGEVLTEGLLALAIGGAYTLHPIVSQGATPIGEPWMITAVEGNIIRNISGRPAYHLLMDTFKALPLNQRHQARRNLLVGLAMDEYKAEFKRGDFLIRNLLAIDPVSGAMAIADEPRIGQTIQFQLRDAEAADEDLHEILSMERAKLGSVEPLAGLLFSCNGRGTGLFGAPDHDARVVAEELGPLPLAGFSCNGEIGPVGPKSFLHSLTASLGLFVPTPKF